MILRAVIIGLDLPFFKYVTDVVSDDDVNWKHS